MKNILILIMCVITLSVHAQDKAYHGDGVDDYLRFVPIVSAVTLKAAGVESASSWKRFAVNSVATFAISSGVTYGLKHAIHERRPDGTDNKSFPSGHSSVAFAGARILDKEFRQVSPWISVAGYGVATFTAIDRVCRNRHKWGDVVVGAGIGVLGTELGYWLGDKITGEHSKYSVGVSGNTVDLVINL